MSQQLQTPSDFAPLTHYIVVMVTPDDRVPLSGSLLALDDEDALSQVRSVTKEHAVDVWDGLRFVGHLPATKPQQP